MATTKAEYEAELVEVRAAISAVLKGQSYTVRDRGRTLPNLAELYRREKYLQAQIARVDRGGVRVRYGTAVE